MKFLMMIKSTEDRKVLPKELVDAIARINPDPVNGIVVASGALAPTASAARIRVSAGQLSVTDGPFSETRELVGGFGILEYASREDALKGATAFMDLYRQYWPGWEGELELRQVLTPEEYARLAQQSR